MNAKKKKNIPTKAELQQLQKLYKTDEKIGERLGGVPAYLVAYWRRKKNIPKHSQPKFSEKEILTLWERFGDDDRCGMELGISKAAFYNWRRRYGIKEKPAFLKLEQLELNFPGLKQGTTTTSLYNKQTLSQKIIARSLQCNTVEVGDEHLLEPHISVTGLEAIDVIKSFEERKNDLVWNPNKITLSLANCCEVEQQPSPAEISKIKEFANRQSIKNVFSSSDGLFYQIAVEKGLILPGQLVVSPASQSSFFGALSTVSMTIDKDSMASLWSEGKVQIKVPSVIRINIDGRRSRGVHGRDIALSVLKQLKTVSTANKIVEYYGSAVSQMNMSERLTLCQVTSETNVVSALCPFDSVNRRYLTGRSVGSFNPLLADKNAEYDEIYQVNIDQLQPQIVRLENDEEIKAAAECEGLSVKTILIGTSANGRFDDLRIAADILKGRQVHPDCRLLIYPASRAVYLEALKKGLIRILVEAKAEIIYPGHFYYNNDYPISAPNEKLLATCTNNFARSLGVDDKDIYLCSPATAAASALNAAISDPVRYSK